MKIYTVLARTLLAAAVLTGSALAAVPASGLDSPVFGTATMTTAPGSPRAVAVGDFNKDGRDDVVAAVTDPNAAPGGVAVALGGDDPVLGAPQMIGAGGPTWSVAVADLNQDGFADIAATLLEGSGVVVLLGNGDGTFLEPTTYATTSPVRGLKVFDANGDGRADIAATEPGLPGLALLTGEDGGFSVAEQVVAGAGNLLGLAPGQLAGDARPDLAVVDNYGASVLVLENTDAGFVRVATLATGEQPRAVAVADLNGDGADDVVASSSIASDIEVFLAEGIGVFSAPLVTPVGEDSRTGAILAADLDIDGDTDLIAANASTGALVALQNDGAGHLSVVQSEGVASSPTGLALGNPDGGTIADVIVADYGDACIRVIPSLQTVLQLNDGLPEPEPAAEPLPDPLPPLPEELPVPVPNTLDSIEVAGVTRYETAVAASAMAFPDGSAHVVVASGENWPDAVTASALAGRLGAPLLLTHRDALPSSVAEEIVRLGADDAFVIGGEAAVSGEVEAAVKSLVGAVTRIAGATRYETSDAVAREVVRRAGAGYDGRAFVATGQTFADALAVSPLANAAGAPVFLTPPEGRPALAAELAADGVTDVVVLGAEAAVGADVEAELVASFSAEHVARIAGADRYETAAAVAAYGVDNDGLRWDGVGLATGADFPDALTGGAMLGSLGSAMLLTRPDVLSAPAEAALVEHAAEVNSVIFLGSTDALEQATRDAVTRALR